jgi:hypothetical protein
MRRIRWRWLIFFAAWLAVPLVVSLVSDVNVMPIAIGWGLIFLFGAGGAGLRARGSAYQTLEQDFSKREADQQFKRPRDEGGLL